MSSEFAAIVTISDGSPTWSVTSSCAFWPVVTVNSLRSMVLKPGSENVIL
jgi:hypothetical protein